MIEFRIKAAQLQAHERQEKVQQEMIAIQIKYQREIDRLEKELQSLKKQLLLRGPPLEKKIVKNFY